MSRGSGCTGHPGLCWMGCPGSMGLQCASFLISPREDRWASGKMHRKCLSKLKCVSMAQCPYFIKSHFCASPWISTEIQERERESFQP